MQVHQENEPIAAEVEPHAEITTNIPQLSEEILKLFGEEPRGDEIMYGEEVNQIIADRWNKYITLGVDKSEKEELGRKYLIPKNLPSLQAPLLNPEIAASLSEANKKEDKYKSTIQGQLGSGLRILAQAVNKMLKGDVNENGNVLPLLVDAGKVLCDTFNMMTTNRKYHVESQVNSTVKKLVRESKPDKFLCGSEFAEKFKETKNQIRTGKELKQMGSVLSKSSTYRRPIFNYGNIAASGSSARVDTATASLNYRSHYNRSRMKKPTGREQKQSQSSKWNHKQRSYKR